LAYDTLGNLTNEKKDWDEAKTLRPHDPFVVLMACTKYMKEIQSTKAGYQRRRLMSIAIALNPASPWNTYAYYNRGVSPVSLGDWNMEAGVVHSLTEMQVCQVEVSLDRVNDCTHGLEMAKKLGPGTAEGVFLEAMLQKKRADSTNHAIAFSKQCKVIPPEFVRRSEELHGKCSVDILMFIFSPV